ncbi:MAG: hypothetical protein K5891_09920 [Lachnospiraceae bacterium]|nr:hypothetical protein [Lachnospiraceae bacterium]
MGDENLNNNEETAALFVSAQKKKKAEEEARKKAAEEQAKRDAAEAEVRRMEQEVEERKRKAEEEAKALEEKQAKEAAAKAAGPIPGETKEKLKETATKANEAAKNVVKKDGKLNLPVIIGGAAALLVIIIIIAVVGGKKGGKGTADLAAADFNAEYTMTQEGFTGVKLSYPDSVFSKAYEEEESGEPTAYFEGSMSVYVKAVIPAQDAANVYLTKNTIGMISAKEREKILTEAAKAFQEGATINSEESADVLADNPGIYYYKSTYTLEKQQGALYAWLEPNGSDAYSIMLAYSASEKADVAALESAVAAFAAKNSDDALKIPGANPPTTNDTEGMLEVDDMHLGLPMPRGQFTAGPNNGGGSAFFFDENGAIIMVVYEETDVDFETAAAAQDILYEGFKEASETSIQTIFPAVESRMFTDETYSYNDKLCYLSHYRDQIGGLTYQESYYASMWRDVRTNQYYFYTVIMIVPEKNKDVYAPLFEKALDRIADI